MNDGGFHQRPEVLVDCLLLGVDRIEKAMQKHRRSGDVLANPSELWGIVPPIDDVALNLAGVTPGRRSPDYTHGAQRGAPSAPT